MLRHRTSSVGISLPKMIVLYFFRSNIGNWLRRVLHRVIGQQALNRDDFLWYDFCMDPSFNTSLILFGHSQQPGVWLLVSPSCTMCCQSVGFPTASRSIASRIQMNRPLWLHFDGLTDRPVDPRPHSSAAGFSLTN